MQPEIQVKGESNIRGNNKKLTPEQVKAMVADYLNTDMSAREVAAKYGVTSSNVVYHANKVRRKEECTI